MQSVSKSLVYVVLSCLLLSAASGVRRSHCARDDDRFGHKHHRVCARIRRGGSDNPIPHPIRPSTTAVLPPDDDDDDRVRLQSEDTHGRLHALCPIKVHQSLYPTFGSRPLPTEVPRHQTLCLLLI
jgi:hypothetical protein